MKSTSRACAIGIIALLFVPGAVAAQSAMPEQAPAADIRPLPPTIPLFPLEDIMLFPDVSRPLYIFEPRYLAMVADALRGDRIIGMIALRPGFEGDIAGRPPVYSIGCAGLITQVNDLPGGQFGIVLHGLVKFRVTSEDQSRPYRLARVEAIPEVTDEKEKAALHTQRKRLEDLLAISIAGSEPPPAELTDEEVVNALAQYLPLEPLKREALLELQGALARSQGVIDLLEKSSGLR